MIETRKPPWLREWQQKRDGTTPSSGSGLTIQLYEEQAAFVFDPARYPAFVAGRNSGKTVAGAIKAANRCAGGGFGIIAAPTYPMLIHAAKRQFISELNRRAEVDRRWSFTEQKSERLLTIPALGTEVLFGSLDNPDSVRGPNAHWGWLDEPGYTSNEAWRTLKGTVRVGDRPQLWTTGTPKGRHHFLYHEWMVAPDAEHTYHHATSLQNPFVDAETYVTSLGYEGVFRDQEIGGEFVAFEGVVYPTFTRAQVRRVDCDGWSTILALDVGTRNPTALLTIRHAGDRIHIERELYRRGMGSSDIVAAVDAEATATKAMYAVVDPSSAGLIKDLTGLGVIARKADHTVIEGISRVTSALPDLTVDPSCVNLIAEFESYQYPSGTRSERDAPVKANDHALDALRYAIMELTGRRQAPTAAPVGIAHTSDWR